MCNNPIFQVENCKLLILYGGAIAITREFSTRFNLLYEHCCHWKAFKNKFNHSLYIFNRQNFYFCIKTGWFIDYGASWSFLTIFLTIISTQFGLWKQLIRLHSEIAQTEHKYLVDNKIEKWAESNHCFLFFSEKVKNKQFQ